MTLKDFIDLWLEQPSSISPSPPPGSGDRWATKQDLDSAIQTIMSAITDFAAKVQANFDKLSNDIDSINTEIQGLNAKIQAFQNSPGTLSTADQAALDDISAKSAALATKADALVVPPVPPVPATTA